MLSAEDRQAMFEILKDTKPDFARVVAAVETAAAGPGG
jgi:hypothetical protein